MLGSIICVAYGYAGYWALLYPWMRFGSLLSGMLMLLFVGFTHLGCPRHHRPNGTRAAP